jgi:hypothetical protein
MRSPKTLPVLSLVEYLSGFLKQPSILVQYSSCPDGIPRRSLCIPLPFLLTEVCDSQELAFRCALLYVGLFTANAFGSVSGLSRRVLDLFCSCRVNDQVNGSWNPCQYGRQTGHSGVAMVGRCFGIHILFSKIDLFRLFIIEVRPCWTLPLNF